MADHAWSPDDRRKQLGEVLRHARWIKKNHRTDAFDEIIAACQRFRVRGFTNEDLKEFSRAHEPPPGWVHPRSDARVQMEREHPRLTAHLDQLKQALYDLRTSGRID